MGFLGKKPLEVDTDRQKEHRYPQRRIDWDVHPGLCAWSSTLVACL